MPQWSDELVNKCLLPVILPLPSILIAFWLQLHSVSWQTGWHAGGWHASPARQPPRPPAAVATATSPLLHQLVPLSTTTTHHRHYHSSACTEPCQPGRRSNQVGDHHHQHYQVCRYQVCRYQVCHYQLHSCNVVSLMCILRPPVIAPVSAPVFAFSVTLASLANALVLGVLSVIRQCHLLLLVAHCTWRLLESAWLHNVVHFVQL